MLLEISTTHHPADDLGYLLHKHPARRQTFDISAGVAHVFYPEVSAARCTAALMIDVDPVALVRGKPGARTLDQYVNDRPYVASSMMAVAIAQVYGTALSGICKQRPELVKQAIPLSARVAAVACRGGEELLRRLFEPLGYQLEITSYPLDERFADWGLSPVFTLTLEATKTLSDLLSHLYVLIPVLDADKHYWVGDEEVAKLLRRGEGWLAAHPARELIARRYLKHRHHLANEAIRQLREQDAEAPAVGDVDTPNDPYEEIGERKLSLHEQRHGTVLSVLQAKQARRVIDLGCGEGRLMAELLKHRTFEKIVGMDVSARSLQLAADRLRLERMPPTVRQRVELMLGSLMYRDKRMEGFDAAVLCEVIEHLDASRLSAMVRVVFGAARPKLVIVTTPNREYNVMWERLSAGSMRHRDHRFEWTREEFRAWTAGVCAQFDYTCEFRAIGPEEPNLGAPTQMGVFARVD